jgi:hypothetical protein
MATYVSAVSWLNSAGPHLRVYTVNGDVITEHCWDGGDWYPGGYKASGTTTAATSWVDRTGEIHMRVYSSLNNQVSEQCWDKGPWYVGALKATGEVAGATTWLDDSGQVHIRVYVLEGRNIVEYCWENGETWTVGKFHGTAG